MKVRFNYTLVIQRHIPLFFAGLFILIGCNEAAKVRKQAVAEPVNPFEQEKAAILQTLNNETKAAFQRDYEAWQENWIHEPTLTKTYMDFTDSSLTETVGWKEISHFVKTFIEEHPEPEPIPAPLRDIDIRLYGDGAWVSYTQKDSLRGLKRETRLMEKENGQWKIAGMHTTIYGFGEKE